jgi:hypothetical protein
MIARLILQTLWSLLAAGAAVLLVLAGFQAAVPHKFPWILVAGAGLLVVFGLVPMLVSALILTRVSHVSIATGEASVSVRVAHRWQTLDLRELVGIGTSRSFSAYGPFVSPKIQTSLVLVDREGHRMSLAWPILTERVVRQIRNHMRDGVIITPLAANLLSEPRTG